MLVAFEAAEALILVLKANILLSTTPQNPIVDNVKQKSRDIEDSSVYLTLVGKGEFAFSKPKYKIPNSRNCSSDEYEMTIRKEKVPCDFDCDYGTQTFPMTDTGVAGRMFC